MVEGSSNFYKLDDEAGDYYKSHENCQRLGGTLSKIGPKGDWNAVRKFVEGKQLSSVTRLIWGTDG